MQAFIKNHCSLRILTQEKEGDKRLLPGINGESAELDQSQLLKLGVTIGARKVPWSPPKA